MSTASIHPHHSPPPSSSSSAFNPPLSSLSSISRAFLESLDSIDGTVEELRNHLGLIGRRYEDIEDCFEDINAFDFSQLNVCVAFSLMSLYFVYLRTVGVDVSTHPLLQELKRAKLHMKNISRMKEAEKEEEGKRANSRPLRVDAEAAERIVRFYTERAASPQEIDVSSEGGEDQAEEEVSKPLKTACNNNNSNSESAFITENGSGSETACTFEGGSSSGKKNKKKKKKSSGREPLSPSLKKVISKYINKKKKRKNKKKLKI